MDKLKGKVVDMFMTKSGSKTPRSYTRCPESQQPLTSSSTSAKFRPPQSPYMLPPPNICTHCRAQIFKNESSHTCCCGGEVRIAANGFPDELMQLLFSNEAASANFRKYILLYNSLFAFTSLGVKRDKEVSQRDHGIYTFRVQGQIYHYINDILPTDAPPRYLQLYFYDSEMEFTHRMNASRHISPDVIKRLMDIMAANPYAQFFHSLKDVNVDESSHIIIRCNPSCDQRTHNAPTSSQVAAIWCEDESSTQPLQRDIIVRAVSGTSHRIFHYYGCYDPLQYPLMFPYGDCGWHQGIKRYTGTGKSRESNLTFPVNDAFVQTIDDLLDAEEQALSCRETKAKCVTCCEYYCYRLQIRVGDPCFLLRMGRLTQQYFVDMYIKIETSRLDFIKNNQTLIRADLYQGIVDSAHTGEASCSNIGHRFILPPSFIGGPRDMKRRYLDAMALVQHYGKPDIFLTVTCNPSWEEIRQELGANEEAQNRPDLAARIFHAKLMEIKKDIVENKVFGGYAAYVYVIEFQKRGLPHAHLLIILDSASKIRSPDQFDAHVCAEIPDPHENPHLYAAVLKHMMHGPCGKKNPTNACMKDGACRNHYPKSIADYTTTDYNSYPIYRRRNTSTTVVVRGFPMNNRWVVPYNPYLLAKYDCHINVEICSTVKAVKYLYKYIYKGHDRVQFNIIAETAVPPQDEITLYQSARWISPPEAAWRIYRFLLNDIYPNVLPLQLHLPDMQLITFHSSQNPHAIIADDNNKRTMLTAFFEKNQGDPKARAYYYHEFPQHYVWNGKKKDRYWSQRQKRPMVGRLVYANPAEGERYYLRLLLLNVRGPLSFADLRTVNGTHYATFREAAHERGLLEEDNAVEKCLQEATQFQMAHALRRLFAMLLVYCEPQNPQQLWNKFYYALSEDYSHTFIGRTRKIHSMTLHRVRDYIEAMGKKFETFNLGSLDEHDEYEEDRIKEIEEELQIPISHEEINAIQLLNIEQRSAFDIIFHKVIHNEGGAFFVDGPGGTGKTFLYSTLLANVRAQGIVALAVATSGIAAANLSGGRTANSRFKLPINLEEQKTANFSKQSGLAKLIRVAKLIIWDEVSMARRETIEIFEAMLRDICSTELPFGGKVVVFGGDFRQVLPVIPKAAAREIIECTFPMSPLWNKVHKIHLTQNMRALTDPLYSKFILDVGNGSPPYHDGCDILLPPTIVVPFHDPVSSTEQLLQEIFPDIGSATLDTASITKRAILTPYNDDTEKINSLLVERQQGKAYVYTSFDEAVDSSAEYYPVEFLNTLTPAGLPPHTLTLKENSPIILLRNLDPTSGLCNGTRLICKSFLPNVIDAEIAVGHHRGARVLIPRIPLQPSTADKYPFIFRRKQFPIKLSFAMTINKAQGQTLEKVGIYLRRPVFSHGQLYVALSRATKGSNVKVLVEVSKPKSKKWQKTRNVVCYEVLRRANII